MEKTSTTVATRTTVQLILQQTTITKSDPFFDMTLTLPVGTIFTTEIVKSTSIMVFRIPTTSNPPAISYPSSTEEAAPPPPSSPMTSTYSIQQTSSTNNPPTDTFGLHGGLPTSSSSISSTSNLLSTPLSSPETSPRGGGKSGPSTSLRRNIIIAVVPGVLLIMALTCIARRIFLKRRHNKAPQHHRGTTPFTSISPTVDSKLRSPREGNMRTTAKDTHNTSVSESLDLTDDLQNFESNLSIAGRKMKSRGHIAVSLCSTDKTMDFRRENFPPTRAEVAALQLRIAELEAKHSLLLPPEYRPEPS